MKYTNWKIGAPAAEAVARLTRHLDAPLAAAVLAARGIHTPAQADAFLNDGLDGLHDPLLLRDAAAGGARIREAISRGEHVAVYGDYDVDGITAAALLADFLRQAGLTCEVYIPDRLSEGYGLNLAAVQTLAALGVSLILTVDCGITAVEEAEHIRAMGMDLIISDHHACKERLPEAAAVINPKRPDCPYPYKELAGVGVAFKLACAASEMPPEALFARYGDLVAVGTVADVMPLTGENRIFVRRGLTLLRAGTRPGLARLIADAGLEREKLGAENIGFAIAPRINAAGRMSRSETALALLLSERAEEAEPLSAALCALNRQRQAIEQDILREAMDMLTETDGGPILLAAEGWHPGVVGIVASRLLERFGVPVILICLENGMGKGSCRSMEGFNIFKALTACGDTLLAYGGHDCAAGLAIDGLKLEDFRKKFFAYFEKNPPRQDGAVLSADFSLADPALLSNENVEALERLAPFGAGNPSPVLLLEAARLLEVWPIGGGKHLKLTAEKWGQVFECVYFGVTKDAFPLSAGDFADLAFTPQINSFRGRVTVQLLIRDCRPALSLCERLCRGEPMTAEEAAALCPARRDFVSLWRYLADVQAKPGLSGSRMGVLSALTKGTACGTPERYYVCLKVLEELGLLALQEEDGALSVEMSGSTAKVDLAASAVLRRIQCQM